MEEGQIKEKERRRCGFLDRHEALDTLLDSPMTGPCHKEDHHHSILLLLMIMPPPTRVTNI